MHDQRWHIVLFLHTVAQREFEEQMVEALLLGTLQRANNGTDQGGV